MSHLGSFVLLTPNHLPPSIESFLVNHEIGWLRVPANEWGGPKVPHYDAWLAGTNYFSPWEFMEKLSVLVKVERLGWQTFALIGDDENSEGRPEMWTLGAGGVRHGAVSRS